MEAISHFRLSLFILNKPGVKIKIRHKLAFTFGSVLPDMIPTTQIIGHTMKGRYKEIRRVIKKIMRNKKLGIFTSLRLGMMIHYLADCFTFPHNPEFQGSMSEHCNYEEKLRILFNSYLTTLPTDGNFGDTSALDEKDVVRMIRQNHKDYIKNRLSKYDDCAYIIATCGMVTQAVAQAVQPSLIDQYFLEKKANLGNTASLSHLYLEQAYPLLNAGG